MYLKHSSKKQSLYSFNEFDQNKIMYNRYKNNEFNDNNSSQQHNRLKQNIKKIIDNELTNIEKNTINLYYYKKMSITSISHYFGVNKSTVSRNLSRALKKLNDFIKYC